MKSNIQKSGISGNIEWALLLLIVVSVGCSKDDPGPSVFINTKPTQVSFIKVNTCHVGGGVYYTEFDFVIPYQTSSPDIEIEKISYTVTVGTTLIEKEDYNFDDDGMEISFSLCVSFAGAPGINYTSSLVSKDGLKSKAANVKIDRPAGAN